MVDEGRIAATQDMTKAARAAGLRYADPSEPGIVRIRQGRGFSYRDSSGRRVTDRATLDRVRALAIPPAWTDVWICASERGHIQAMGRDARGRRQYRYHADWTSARDQTKFERSIAFARALPRLRRRVARDLRRPGMPRDKVLAAVVRLLDRTLLRVGNERYARDNNSFGLTTLRNRHARSDGNGGMRLAFRGKSGKRHEVALSDRRLVRVIRACQDLPGQRLFMYRDDDGEERPIESNDVNDYIRAATGDDFTAKDFRTWAATVLAAQELRHSDDVPAAVKAVAAQLGNTPAVCRNSYINPAVLVPAATREHAHAAPVLTRPVGLSSEERRVLALLRRARWRARSGTARPARAAERDPAAAHEMTQDRPQSSNVYRGPQARNGNGNGNGHGRNGNGHGRNGRRNGRGNPTVRRIAIARVRSKSVPANHAGRYAMLAVLGVVGFFGSIAGSFGLGTATALSFINKMESELPPVTNFEQLDFAQPTVVYDRTGTIELARFQIERRRVVAFEDIPKVLLDATIAVEDQTFWDNEGYDPNAIVSAALESLAGEGDRGASTITQQLVRQRLLDPELVADPDRLLERKVKEILLARNLTNAYPGDEGKQRILTAYLNQIYYGHSAYGIAAAAEVYFGVTDLKLLTPAQAAILAGLPQAPNSYDLYKWAEVDENGQLFVPLVPTEAHPDVATPVKRRNKILENLERGDGHFIRLTPQQLDQALAEPIILHPPTPFQLKAPHFVFYMKNQLEALVADRAPVERGGYRVITTLDMGAQALAEKYVAAGTIVPNLTTAEMNAEIEAQGLQEDRRWIEALHGTDVHNGSLVAIDARTGQIVAYVGSAGYYRDDIASPQFDPKYDVAGTAIRQPGSAWKPIVYTAGFDAKVITPGTLLNDVVTEFARDWFPRDADRRERGPVLMREALTYSLNIPAIRALDRIGVDAVATLATNMGITYPNLGVGGADTASLARKLGQAGLAGAIGTVEVNQVELTAGYAALANRGVEMPVQTILSITDANGNPVPVPPPAPKQVVSEQAAWMMTDILKDSTDPEMNTVFGPRLQIVNGVVDPLIPGSSARRPAAAKTGTANDLRDLLTFGYLAPPADPNAMHIVASVWTGNSDHSAPNAGDFSIIAADGPGRIWSAFLRELSREWPMAAFPTPPPGVVAATIDAWSGGAPGPWTRDTRTEWFIEGTQPGGPNEIDPPGLLYRQMCNRWFVDIAKAEATRPPRWVEANVGWMERARRGTGQRGEHGGVTAHLFGRSDWGGFIAPLDCSSAPQPTPQPPPPGTPGPGPSQPPETPKPTDAPPTEPPSSPAT